MNKLNSLKVWAGQIRAPFLILSVMLVAIGGAVAFHIGSFHGLRFLCCMFGVILAHSTVNLFNELSDYKTGIDRHTTRTPFSGGSGNLPAGFTTWKSVLSVAIILSGLALICGIYLTLVSGWLVIILMVIGGLTVIFYTSHLARWGIGEIAAGLCLGSLVVIGTFYTQTGRITSEIVLLSIPPGILTALLLFLNEFPDVKADKKGGRKHLVIILGWKAAAKLYTAALILLYSFVVLGVILKWFPPLILIIALTLPLSVKAISVVLHSGNQIKSMIPALGANVMVVLGIDMLIAVSYVISLKG